jgi:hypothetical protein
MLVLILILMLPMTHSKYSKYVRFEVRILVAAAPETGRHWGVGRFHDRVGHGRHNWRPFHDRFSKGATIGGPSTTASAMGAAIGKACGTGATYCMAAIIVIWKGMKFAGFDILSTKPAVHCKHFEDNSGAIEFATKTPVRGT